MNKKEDFLSVLNFRYACKQFDTDKKISEDDFNYILEAGRLSPSAFGYEPWNFLVVQNMDLREKIRGSAWGAQTQLPTASHFIILLARKAKSTVAGSEYITHINRHIKGMTQEFIDAKTIYYGNFQKDDFDLTNDRKLFDWATKQTYIPFTNMMTAAAYLGIDSCPIEGFNREAVEAILEEEKILNREEFGVAVFLALGYRAADSYVPKKTRQELGEIVKYIY